MKQSARPSVVPACDPDDHAAHPSGALDEEALVRAAGFFRAAGDVSRLRILARLADGERCVTELAQAAHAPLPTVSQQLRLLRAEGLVKRRRVAKHVYYAVADAHIADLVRNALAHASETTGIRDGEDD